MNPKVPVMDAYKTIVQPGDIKYMDITNNGTIDGDDRRIIGNPNPALLLCPETGCRMERHRYISLFSGSRQSERLFGI